MTGMEDSCFDCNYEGKKMLPLVEELPFVPMETEEIINSLGITKEQGPEMIVMCVRSFKFRNGFLCIWSARREKGQFKNLF